MRRALPVLAVLLAPLSGHAGSVTTPIAPTTPTTFSINAPTAFTVTAPSGFTPAPVPNQDITPWTRIEDGGPKLSGRLQQPRILLRSGDGFTPGSNFSEDLERRSRGGVVPGLTPILTVKVPLD